MSVGSGVLRILWPTLSALGAWGCDGEVVPNDGGGGSSSATTGTGAAANDCQTVDGFRVCGGSHDCGDDKSLEDCGCYDVPAQDVEIAVCANEFVEFAALPRGCPDGLLKLDFGGGANFCAPFSLGMLFCENDASDAVRFVDNAAFDCAPLPEPTTCPPATGIQLCGDVCGPCGAAEVCTGRSKAHPHSLCLPETQGSCSGLPTSMCDPGERCLVYLVGEPDQPIADRNGMCVPQTVCEAAVTELPGGAKCVGS